MERYLYISDAFSAVTEDGRLVEYIPENPEIRAGEILRGRVRRIMASLQCAFVDIGRKRSGFLPLKENSSTFRGGEIRSGGEVWVQIHREETGEKGAFLTRDLTVPGSCLILMPMNRHIGVSARVTDEEERRRLQQLGRELARDRFGLVLRAAACQKNEGELRSEADALLLRWEEAREAALGDPERRVILSCGTPGEDLLRDYEPRGITGILRDAPADARMLQELRQAEAREVRLPHGGNIVIDRCEAMTVIDVNTAGDARGGRRRETILETNLEACREIAVQTRLRNLSGILILDMIDMEAEEDRTRILRELERAFEADRIKTVIHGFTRLGLVEMTRKRSRPALEIRKEEK